MLLKDEEIAAALARLPGWQQAPGAVRRIYAFDDFARAMKFVHRVADLADALDHVPEVLIRNRHVTITLSSPDTGGVTERDLEFARRLDHA